jgi:chemotaxis methyl-accepting protein methylase
VTDPRGSYRLPLAQGDLSPQDALELQHLKDHITKYLGFQSDSYKEHCLRRRIAVRMRACGVHTYADYADLLVADEAERNRLLATVTINVSKFFRNREMWSLLEREVVPKLFELRARPTRVWSAGCAGGEEPYTIAMMLRNSAQRLGKERLLHRFQIVGSDIDLETLDHARSATYADFAFTEIAEEERHTWFQPPEYRHVKPEIRRMVRFAEVDLIKDPFPPDQHLIFCRNVIIYFERGIQEDLFMKFYDALAPGGFLVLGKVETICGRAQGLLKPISQRERVYVKP